MKVIYILGVILAFTLFVSASLQWSNTADCIVDTRGELHSLGNNPYMNSGNSSNVAKINGKYYRLRYRVIELRLPGMTSSQLYIQNLDNGNLTPIPN